MDGPDSDRMFAEIEAFLRTGEAPPPAPEPAPVAPPAGPAARAPRGPLARRPSPPRRDHPRRRRSDFEGWGRISRPPAPDGTPTWSLGRILAVVALIGGLAAVPLIYPSRHPASSAPAPGFAFLRSVPGTGKPVRWDPCSPIHYRTDLAGGPAYLDSDLRQAVGMISQATGILFVDDGPTTVRPDGSWKVGDPVTIFWAPAGGSGATAASGSGAAAGATSAETIPPQGLVADQLAQSFPVEAVGSPGPVYVTGQMELFSGAAVLPEGFGPGSLGELLLGQFGRLMGLAPVADPSEVMFPQILPDRAAVLGAGDVAGLRQLGRAAGCVSVPAPATLVPAV